MSPLEIALLIIVAILTIIIIILYTLLSWVNQVVKDYKEKMLWRR